MDRILTAGNWEGGYTAEDGTRWVHEPHLGWRRDTSPFVVRRRVSRVRRLLEAARVLRR